MQKITPFLWYDQNAEEAVHFYASVFKNAKIHNPDFYDEAGALVSGQPKGSIMTIPFEIEGMQFVALNGGPMFKFTPAVSFMVDCATQDEVDHYWERLVEGGGKHTQCGWLEDRFGVSWQIVPKQLGELMSSGDKAQSERVMKAMLSMSKLDIAVLEAAAKGD